MLVECFVGASNKFDHPKTTCVLTTLVLTAISAVGSYYALVYGFDLLDAASSSLQEFEAVFLIWSGAVYSIVAAGNGLFFCWKLFFDNSEYKPDFAAEQIGLSLTAPVAAIPALVFCGILAVTSKS